MVQDVTAISTRRGLFADLRAWLAHCAVLLRAQLWTMAGAALTCTAVLLLAGDRGLQREPFAIPAMQAANSPWAEQVSHFATRVHKAFGISHHVAAEFSGWILEASQRQGLTPELLASVVFTESTFRKEVTSEMGAIGPAQVKPYWSRFCGSANLADPAENIYCGAQILAHYRDVCGSEECALSAYNVGMRNERTDEYYQQLGRVYARKVDAHVERFASTSL